MQFDFGSFRVVAPDDWEDITAYDVEGHPATLAGREGAGALQFSITSYASGPPPNPTAADLMDMLQEFAASRELGPPKATRIEQGPPLMAVGDFDWDADFLRVWQVSDGRSFAFVTYVCNAAHAGPELPICDAIVSSLVFDKRPR